MQQATVVYGFNYAYPGKDRFMSARIQMMGMFVIEANGVVYDNLETRSRKGVNLMRFLIMQQGRPVSSQRLIRVLQAGRRTENPEGALKTLVSRTRAMLNRIEPGLGRCIASAAGGYRWSNVQGVKVDALQIMDILAELQRDPPEEVRREKTETLLTLYRGDLEDAEWMHREYLDAIYDYAAMLNAHEEYNRVVEVCDRALAVDGLDEQLHILRMEAMQNLNRHKEALDEYRRVARQSRDYFDAEPSEELQSVYRELVEAGETLRFNLDVIHNELTREEADAHGPYFCDYTAFKFIYNIEIRNIERLGATMSLGVVMLEGEGNVAEGMAELEEILRTSLRRGDIVTQFSENTYALLLPTANYGAGGAVLERIEQRFNSFHSESGLMLYSRIRPISCRAMG